MSKALTDTLQTIQDKTNGDKISFSDINEALKHRGFGPLLIAPTLIIILPTGAIPGIPALCALFIMLIAGQIVIGRNRPWFPQKLKEFSFSREKYNKSVALSKPYTKWIDDFFHPRFQFLTYFIAQRIIAGFCIILSIAIIILGFVPFAAILPAAAILLFGLALSVHDGLLAAFGLLLMTVTFIAAPFLISNLLSNL